MDTGGIDNKNEMNFGFRQIDGAEESGLAIEVKPILEILYQDEYLVAINKPAGLFVHRSYMD
jgi:23S rRNA-/tRNA-specific pseudouridylate synthase